MVTKPLVTSKALVLNVFLIAAKLRTQSVQLNAFKSLVLAAAQHAPALVPLPANQKRRTLFVVLAQKRLGTKPTLNLPNALTLVTLSLT